VRIALAQINPTVGDFSGNLQKIREFTERAVAERADLVIFPELAICGYPPADLLEKESFVKRAEASLAEVAALTKGEGRPAILCGTALSVAQPTGKHVRNVAALLEAGEIRCLQQKMLLPFYDVFDEQRYFEPATHQSLAVVKGQAVALTVCEDAWNDKVFWPRRNYSVDPVEELMKQWAVLPQPLGGQRLILNISASPYWHGKVEVRQRMIGALAKRHHATVVLVNQVGANDSLVFDGNSFVAGPDGEIVAQARGFAEDLVIFDTDSAPAVSTGIAPVPETDAATQTALTWQALVLGTRDYVRKCGFKKAILGLSGGIDSALVAAIAVEALGAENVQGIGMPSEFSSTGSVSDAEKLAQNLGIPFSVVPVREIYTQFSDSLQPFFAGTPFGLAEENLQPRIRGSLLMALSNKTGALVLTTGNKSEMATGYCTLYGDMVGALAVIGDVYKTEVYALSHYANREREIIPEDTLTKPPSAELRPGQKDTDSLPPYEVLDPILRAYIEDYVSAEEIAAMQGVDANLVRSVIQLVERSEYKRQQAAPVLKVSKKSFGMGRRFPIAAKREV
jgi:NAD+ synthase (glutamine-hydrolysing)